MIAEKFGIEKTAMIRARAGIGYALTEAMDEGHCGLPLAELVPMAVALLEVPAEIIETALDLELRDGAVAAYTVDSERCIFLAGLHRAERAIAARIKALSIGALPGLNKFIDPCWINGACPRCGAECLATLCEECSYHFRPEQLVNPAVREHDWKWKEEHQIENIGDNELSIVSVWW